MYKSELETDIQFLPGVGPKRAAVLKTELGVTTFGDLIGIYPFRYIDRSSIQKIAGVNSTSAYIQIKAQVVRLTLLGQGGQVKYSKELSSDGKLNVLFPDVSGNTHKQFAPGEPELSKLENSIKFNTVKRLSAVVRDDSGQMELVFFRGVKYTFSRLFPGSVFVFFGKPSTFSGQFNMVHPEIDDPASEHQDGLNATMTGVYNSTEKLRNAGITGKTMNKMMANALRLALADVKETLPQYVLAEKELVPLQFALKNIHFPSDTESLDKAVRRLKFEELFLLQLSLLKQKFVRSRNSVGIVMNKVGPDFNLFYNSLPYALTGAQQRVTKEIRADLMSGHQMNRLVQGDVGSGKTLVAVMASLIAIGNGYQACIMAPTEVLARQHFKNIVRYLKPTGVKTALLTGSTGVAERREIHYGLQDGSIGLIVGTHALIEDNVLFRNLGLAVVDEQHRFGVEQRAKLWNKRGDGVPPHILVMTATPIPRTLAMTFYGDLDVSVIDEMPPGRKPIETFQITDKQKGALFRFMKKEIAEGRQVFVVYPMIFENEKLDYKNLEQGYEEIVKHFPLPEYKVVMVHGKQSTADKDFYMSAFAGGRAHILVATTVIEVGVDVPNASVMVIQSAERFGLSQLHQLRGRVGRGAEKSYCILVRGDKVSRESMQRINLLCETEDGFAIAEEDMKMRGPGDLEGTAQSGLPIELNIASLARDGRILSEAREYAEFILEGDPSLSAGRNSLLAEAVRSSRYAVRDYSRIS